MTSSQAAGSRVAVGLIGFGYWGPNLARNIDADPNSDLVAVCDLDPVRLAAASARYGDARPYPNWEGLLADPGVEAVAIATPASTHFSVALGALEAGKHVLVEKPMTTSAAEAAVLVATAKDRGLVLMVDHVFLYSPAVEQLSELVWGGHLGEVLFIDSVRISLGVVQPDVSAIWDLAAHDVAIVDHLLGRPPSAVQALVARPMRHTPGCIGYLHVHYGAEFLASIHVNWLSPVKIRHLLVGGSERSAVYDDLNPAEPLKLYDRGVDPGPCWSEARGPAELADRASLVSYRLGSVVSPWVPRDEPLSRVVAHFVERVRSGEPPRSGGSEGLRIVQILEAAEVSAQRAGVEIPLDA
jgi:predicted dehydrogenase